MVNNKVIVDLEMMKYSPEYFQEKMLEAREKRMIFGDAIWEIIYPKITNWRQVIENGY